jgi:thioesterase domain-containing protein
MLLHLRVPPALTEDRLSVKKKLDKSSSQEIEKVLKNLWEDLLEVDVQPTDDFFEIGGYSFLAVQMVNELRESGHRITASDVYEHRTLEALASHLASGQSSDLRPEPTFAALWSQASSPWSGERPKALVPLAEGEREPFFWVHWGTGNIGFLRGLAGRISGGRPVYGFQHPALVRRERVEMSVGELAESYLAELLKTQPEGPYLLGGLCNGSNIALEMARRLTERGKNVALLVFVNGYPNSFPSDINPGDGPEGFYQLRLATLKQRFGVDNLAAAAPEVMKQLQAEDVAYYDGHESPDDLMWFQAVWAAIAFAHRHHDPRPFPGRTLVFQTKKGEPAYTSHWKALVPSSEAETFDVRSTLPILQHPPFQESITRHLSRDF